MGGKGKNLIVTLSSSSGSLQACLSRRSETKTGRSVTKKSYDKNIGGKLKILSDLLRLCFAQSILTFLAVSEVPPFE